MTLSSIIANRKIIHTLTWSVMGMILISLWNTEFWLGSLLVHYSFYLALFYLILYWIDWKIDSSRLFLITHGLILVSFITYLVLLYYATPYRTVQHTESKSTTRLVIWNVNVKNDKLDEIVDSVMLLKPDILVIEELNYNLYNKLKYKFLYNLAQPKLNYFGIGVFSQIPVHNPSIFAINKMGHAGIQMELMINNRLMHLYALHINPPLTPYNFRLQKEGFAFATSKIGKDSIPKIICGDLNCTTYSDLMQNLLKELKVAKVRISPFWKKTWRLGFLPLLELDHVLVSDSLFIIKKFEYHSFTGSDHRLICMDFSI